MSDKTKHPENESAKINRSIANLQENSANAMSLTPPVQGKFNTVQREEVKPDEDKVLSAKFKTVQREEVKPDEDKVLSAKFVTVQREVLPEEKPPILGKFKGGAFQLKSVAQREEVKENKTGLPDQLKSGVENLSGLAMDDVKVHYNSSQPAQLNAHAYAQGSEIHVAPGQEQHLPHEAWHVAQQKQGRVQPTMQMKMGVPVNDDPGLESEADLMGAKAMQMPIQPFRLKK
jgi:Domain of unknown function (DUF4157)